MSLRNRIVWLEKELANQTAVSGLSVAETALDATTIDLSIEPLPDDRHAAMVVERLEAKRDRLQCVHDSGDDSGLLPGDLEILPAAVVLAGN